MGFKKVISRYFIHFLYIILQLVFNEAAVFVQSRLSWRPVFIYFKWSA